MQATTLHLSNCPSGNKSKRPIGNKSRAVLESSWQRNNHYPCTSQPDNNSNTGAHNSLFVFRLWCQSLLLPLPALWGCPGSSMTGVAGVCSRTTCTPSITMLPPLLGRPPRQQPRVRTRGSAQPAYPSWLRSLPGTSGAAPALHLTMGGPCSSPHHDWS